MADSFLRVETSSITTTKARLRTEIKERLVAQTSETTRWAAEQLADRVMATSEIRRSRGVLVCLSFGIEVDTWKLVDRLLESGRRVYVPRAVSRTKQLHIHPYPCPLKTLSFGLRQPAPAAPELDSREVDAQIDAALILGLAFDRRGYRLGYGGGFFDRFLAGRSFPAIGLAFEMQIQNRLPTEAHDVSMTAVASERAVFNP